MHFKLKLLITSSSLKLLQNINLIAKMFNKKIG